MVIVFGYSMWASCLDILCGYRFWLKCMGVSAGIVCGYRVFVLSANIVCRYHVDYRLCVCVLCSCIVCGIRVRVSVRVSRVGILFGYSVGIVCGYRGPSGISQKGRRGGGGGGFTLMVDHDPRPTSHIATLSHIVNLPTVLHPCSPHPIIHHTASPPTLPTIPHAPQSLTPTFRTLTLPYSKFPPLHISRLLTHPLTLPLISKIPSLPTAPWLTSPVFHRPLKQPSIPTHTQVPPPPHYPHSLTLTSHACCPHTPDVW